MTNVYDYAIKAPSVAFVFDITESCNNVYDTIVKLDTVGKDIEKEFYLSFPKQQYT